VQLVGRDGTAVDVPPASKADVAHVILDRIVGLLASEAPRRPAGASAPQRSGRSRAGGKMAGQTSDGARAAGRTSSGSRGRAGVRARS
jgi:hypothetical protein